MSAPLRQSHSSSDARIALGASHGYRFEGDTAILNAELAISGPDAAVDDSRAWALQLWACDTPFEGGSLDGIKVAEAPLSLPSAVEGARPQLEVRSFALLPPGQRDYAMVMVLASGARGSFDQVDDFANYAARQRFVVPCLEGGVAYHIEGAQLTVQAERVRNPRPADNLSGTLSLELWALAAPYAGGTFSGTRIGQVELVPLCGQDAHAPVSATVPAQLPPPGSWQLTLMLREWTAAEGYVTRDYRSFAIQYVVDAPPAPRTAEPIANLSIVPNPAAVTSPRKIDVSAQPGPAPAARTARSVEASGSARERKMDAPKLMAVPPLPNTGNPATDEATGATRISAQQASLEELARVPGLNRKLATSIVRARPLRSLDDLKRVRGIGDKLLRSLRAHLTV